LVVITKSIPPSYQQAFNLEGFKRAYVSVTLISFVRQRHEECFTVELLLEKDAAQHPLTHVKQRR